MTSDDWPEVGVCEGGVLPERASNLIAELLKAATARWPMDAASIASLAGAPPEVCWAVFHLATINTIGGMSNVLRDLGIETRAELLADVEFVQPDWSIIAGREVTDSDVESWITYARSRALKFMPEGMLQ